jgi:hypothetical protein
VSWLGATVKPRIAWSRSVKLTAPRQHYGERGGTRALFIFEFGVAANRTMTKGSSRFRRACDARLHYPTETHQPSGAQPDGQWHPRAL